MGRQVDTTPSEGDTAVKEGVEYGHVLYVEEVNSHGPITLSDYNFGVLPVITGNTLDIEVLFI
jgi:surface antigen